MNYIRSLLGSLNRIPGFLAERAGIFLLGSPATDAVGVVGVIACAPADHAALAVRDLIGLAFETGLVDAVFADGAVLDGYVPAPESHCVPLFDFYAFVDLHHYKNLNCRLAASQKINNYSKCI